MKSYCIFSTVLCIFLTTSCCPPINTEVSHIAPKVTMQEAAELAENFIRSDEAYQDFEFIYKYKEVRESIFSFSKWNVYFHIKDNVRPSGLVILVDKITGECSFAPWH